MNFIKTNNLLFGHLFWFPSKLTTSMALLDIYSKLVDSFEKNEYASCIFLEFVEGFDNINHNILLTKLDNYGIRG